MIHIGLFEGIGGFSLAASWMGWQTYLTCEINPFAQRVLKYYWPDAYHHGDIKTLTYETVNAELTKRYGEGWRKQPIILTGGFPCQPFSVAGKRRGTEDDRYLWPEMLRAIREIKPDYVVGENVHGLLSWSNGLVLEQVLSDLEADGYEAQTLVLPAAGVNAPHKRNRVWIVAKNTNYCRCLHGEIKQEGADVWQQRNTGTGGEDGVCLQKGITANTNCNGCHKCNGNNEKHTSKRGFDALNDFNEATMHTNGTSKQGEHIRQTREGKFNGSDSRDGFNNFQNFPTQSPICSGDDGISNQLDGITFPKWRTESVKAYGNAIVPHLAYAIFKAIERS